MRLPEPPAGFVMDGGAEPPARKPVPGKIAPNIPPPPGGFDVDPLETVRGWGAEITSGFRTPADQTRIRNQGYTPAANSRHLDADAIDLVPGKSGMSMGALHRRALDLAAHWPGAKALNEGHHIHIQLPGWGGAPGLPPPPPGATIADPGSGEPDVAQLRMSTIDQGTAAGNWTPEEANRLKANIAAESALYPDGKVPVVESPTVGWKPADLVPDVASKLTPEQLNEYLAVAADPKSTADQLRATMKKFGYDLNNADDIIKARNVGLGVIRDPQYNKPKPLAAPEGTIAAAERGALDTTNLLDEIQAVRGAAGQGLKQDLQGLGTNPLAWVNLAADTLLPQSGETMFDGRGFGDVVDTNIDLNRARLEQDARDHPIARMTGQIAAGSIVPLGAANRARDVAKIAGIEGAVSGFGAGEGNPLQRLPSTAAGAAIGATGGYALGSLVDRIGVPAYRALRRRYAGASDEELETILRTGAMDDGTAARTGSQADWDEIERAADLVRATPIQRATAQEPPVTTPNIGDDGKIYVGRPGDLDALDYRDQSRALSMPAEFDTPTLTARVPDTVDATNLPPPPDGFLPEEVASLRAIAPEDVTPIPSNQVESLEEFERAVPGSVQDVVVPRPETLQEMRTARNAKGHEVRHRGPIDLEAQVRLWGGLRDEGGELFQAGITNNYPRVDAPGDKLLGPILNRNGKAGMTYDEAAERLWEAGYFPNHVEPPSRSELVEALRLGRSGNRTWHPNDLGEVARFEGATATRNAADEAAQEGRPLAEVVGSPATLEDVSAALPVTAYEDLPKIGGRIGNINLGKIDSQLDIRRALQAVERNLGGFETARRGKVSHAETEALARELDLTPDDLLTRRKGQALNAEQALAARQLLARSGDELVRFAERARGGSEEELAAFHKSLLRHAAIQEQVTGATAEAGRALQSFKIPAKAGAARLRVLKDIVESGGGRESLEDIAKRIVDLERDPARLNSYALKATKPRFRDKLSELYINSLLSGPQTHVVNIVSNALTALGQIPEHLVAAAIGAGRQGVQRAAVDRVLFSEVSARATGMLSALPEGLKEGLRVFRTEQPLDWVTRLEQTSHQAISGTKGKLIRVPARAMTAMDEVFKGIARNSTINGLAVRKAYLGGLRGEKAVARAAELAASPSDDMIEEAFDYARYLTFQSKVGPIASGIMKATNEMPLLKIVVPFVRTPTNLMKFAVERSPAAPFIKRWRDDVLAGGARRDLAISKAVVGSGIGATIASLAAQGLVTGSGPADDKARRLMVAEGWQPYSIKVGDQWVSYSRLDPFATTLGVAADLATKSEHMTASQRDKMAVTITSAIMQQLESKTWLSGVSDLIQAINDSERFGPAYLSRVAGSLAVPTGVAQVARTLDPVQRDTRGVPNPPGWLPGWMEGPAARIQSRIPGLSEELPARHDIFGREIVSEGGLGPDILSPAWIKTQRDDPVAKEMLTIGATFGSLPRKTKDVEHTPEQQSQYEALAGRYTYEDIAEAMTEPGWGALDDEAKADRVDDIKRDARAAARDELGLGIPPPPVGFAVEAAR